MSGSADPRSRVREGRRLLTFGSGGWVLALASLIALAVIAWFLVPVFRGAALPGEGVDRGFVLEPSRVDLDSLVSSSVTRDGLKALVEPPTVTPDHVDFVNEEKRGKYLVSTDWVIGVRVGGEARAYPLRILNWHEIVNDTLGGRPIAVTYSPLTRSVRVFDREVERADGTTEVLELGVSGLLRNSNLVMFDRRAEHSSESLWSQLEARAITGPASVHGARLATYTPSLVSWGTWRSVEPETTVIEPDTALTKLYKRNPYGAYFQTGELRFPAEPEPPTDRLQPMDPIVVVEALGERYVVPLARGADGRLDDLGRLPDEVAGALTFEEHAGLLGALVDSHRDDGAETVVEDALFTLWFAWYASSPERPGVLVRPPGA